MNGIVNQSIKEKNYTLICKCGHADFSHLGKEGNLKTCKSYNTLTHKGLDLPLCKCKKFNLSINTSLENIHLEEF